MGDGLDERGHVEGYSHCTVSRLTTTVAHVGDGLLKIRHAIQRQVWGSRSPVCRRVLSRSWRVARDTASDTMSAACLHCSVLCDHVISGIAKITDSVRVNTLVRRLKLTMQDMIDLSTIQQTDDREVFDEFIDGAVCFRCKYESCFKNY